MGKILGSFLVALFAFVATDSYAERYSIKPVREKMKMPDRAMSKAKAMKCDELWQKHKTPSVLKEKLKECIAAHNRKAPKAMKMKVCDKGCLKACDEEALKKGKGRPSAVRKALSACIIRG